MLIKRQGVNMQQSKCKGEAHRVFEPGDLLLSVTLNIHFVNS